MKLLDFGVTRSKVTGLIMYAKIACDRVISRTDKWNSAKPGPCMYFAEEMS